MGNKSFIVPPPHNIVWLDNFFSPKVYFLNEEEMHQIWKSLVLNII